MIYCINPSCPNRLNPDDVNICRNCGTALCINASYRLLKPVRPLNPNHYTDVFEAVHIQTGEHKIIKVLKKNEPKLLELFEREASVLHALDCKGIPKVDLDSYFEIIPQNASFPLHCIVMDKIEGQNLDQWLQGNGPISSGQAHDWLTQITRILDCVHKANYFHRDIKSSNIIIQPDGSLALIDFGTVRDNGSATYLAKISGEENRTGIARSTDITIFQSPGFTPPEQFNGKASPQSDFYALGRTIIHLLTGIHPGSLREDEDTGRLIWRKGLDIDKPLADLIDWMTEPDPLHRPKTTRVILHELNQRKPRSKAIRHLMKSKCIWGAGFGALVLVSFLGYNTLNFLKSTVSATYVGMGDQGRRLGNSDGAKEDYQNALWWNPKNGNASYNLGIICREQKDYGCALKNFNQALQTNLNDWTEYLNIGEAFDEQGQYAKAEQLYQTSRNRARERKRDLGGRPLNNLSRLKNVQGKYDEAILLAIEGLKTQGLVADTQGALYKNLGWAYVGKGEPEKAIPLLQKSISYYSNRADIYCLLSQAKARLRTMREFNEELNQCFKIESNLPEVKIMRDDLVNKLLLKK